MENNNRGEIHWKLQNLSESINTSLEVHQNERNSIMGYWEKYFEAILKLRNNLIAAIGFAIGFWISLISLGIIENDRIWDVIYGIIAIATIFFGINTYLDISSKKYFEIDLEYEEGKQNLLEYKGVIFGISLRDEIKNDQIESLVYTSFALVSSISYQLKMKAHKKLKIEKPDQDEYRKSYDDAKKNLEIINTVKLKFVNKINKFIAEYEKNEKSSKDSSQK